MGDHDVCFVIYYFTDNQIIKTYLSQEYLPHNNLGNLGTGYYLALTFLENSG